MRLDGVPLEPTALPLVSLLLEITNITPPMIAIATTTAPTTSKLRVRSLRCCSRISAWARSDFDC